MVNSGPLPISKMEFFVIIVNSIAKSPILDVPRVSCYIILMMMMVNCFCGMVDRQKVFSLISNWDHCQRSSPSRISDTLRAGFEPAQNLSSGFDK